MISMATEETVMSNGWPLGLEIMNMRLRVTESLQAALRSPTFSSSSSSSSNLDTESTASFFQDNSTSLGRLIGIRPGNQNLYSASKMRFGEQDRERKSAIAASSQVSRPEMSQGICIPLLVGTLEKMSRSRSKSKLKR